MKNYNPAFEELTDRGENPEERLTRRIGEVKERWLIKEQPFRSRLPFVASLRSRFNSISTRWYVQPLLAQQVEFNGAVSRALEDLGKLTVGSEAASDAQAAILAARMLGLEARLERIEKLLEELPHRVNLADSGFQVG